MSESDDVKRAVRELNACWIAGRVDDLPRFFHARVVAVPPGSAPRSVGRDAMIQGFKDYLAAAKTLAFEETSLDVDVFDGTAVATLRFHVRYQMGDAIYDETGADLMVLVREHGTWLIAWRTQLPQSTTG